jgi:hypothetical protein
MVGYRYDGEVDSRPPNFKVNLMNRHVNKKIIRSNRLYTVYLYEHTCHHM